MTLNVKSSGSRCHHFVWYTQSDKSQDFFPRPSGEFNKGQHTFLSSFTASLCDHELVTKPPWVDVNYLARQLP